MRQARIDLQLRLLDDVGRVHPRAQPVIQPERDLPHQLFAIPREQLGHGRAVSLPGPLDQPPHFVFVDHSRLEPAAVPGETTRP
jgi:hypothetical protein